MKTINNFIVEHLEYSTFSINEKLRISSKTRVYTCQPKDKYELREILEERLAEDKNADLNDIDVSKITDMSYLFINLDPHNIDISEWDVSNVTNMSYMFRECQNLNCDLSNWNVSKVTDMRYMFKLCTRFNSDIGNWDVRKVKDMSGMFSYSSFDGDISKWFPKSLKYTDAMCYKCPLDFHTDKMFINVKTQQAYNRLVLGK